MTKKDFNKWLENLIELHNIDLNIEFNYEGKECINIIDLHSIINSIKESNLFSQLQIKDKINTLDKDNLLLFFKDLGKYLVY